MFGALWRALVVASVDGGGDEPSAPTAPAAAAPPPGAVAAAAADAAAASGGAAAAAGAGSGGADALALRRHLRSVLAALIESARSGGRWREREAALRALGAALVSRSWPELCEASASVTRSC